MPLLRSAFVYIALTSSFSAQARVLTCTNPSPKEWTLLRSVSIDTATRQVLLNGKDKGVLVTPENYLWNGEPAFGFNVPTRIENEFNAFKITHIIDEWRYIDVGLSLMNGVPTVRSLGDKGALDCK